MRSLAIRSGVVKCVPGDPPLSLFPHDAGARRLWAFWQFPIRCVCLLYSHRIHSLYIAMDTIKKTADTVVSENRPDSPLPALPAPLARARARGIDRGSTGATMATALSPNSIGRVHTDEQQAHRILLPA